RDAQNAPDLLPQHQKKLDDSAIKPEVARARGYCSFREKEELKDKGFSTSQRAVPALGLPIYNPHAERVCFQIRPDSPRADKDGNILKHELPWGTRMVLDVPPGTRPHIGNPTIPLIITEGPLKADAALSHGLCAVALLGVHCWRGTNPDGGRAVLTDF